MPIFSGKNLETVLLISFGAVLGANLRYWLGSWIAERWGAQFPTHTLLINLTGSLLLGFFTVLLGSRLPIDPRWRVFFAIGFLGSFTTFSTYTLESVALWMGGNWQGSLFNLVGSTVLGALAVILGLYLGRMAGAG